MYVPEYFKPSDEDVAELLRRHGAVDLVTATPDGLRSTMLPMVWDEAANVLRGHVARKNDHWQQDVVGQAMAIIRGPDAYITPTWYATKREHGRVVPTWNYITAHAYGTLTIHHDPAWLEENVRQLTDKHEGARQPAWAVEDAPAAYVEGQLRAIVGVELAITRIEAKFKLSQNRTADIHGVVEGLNADGRADMASAVEIGRTGCEALMSLIVQKYGGTSVGSAERIRRVAERIGATAAAGAHVCVVVSAMGDTTDDLIGLAEQVATDPHDREMDMLLSAGERISMALVSMALIDAGHKAISFTGQQAGIITDDSHGRAKIIAVQADRVRRALDAGKIAIVAGFQGVSTTDDVTTLGRGGSDMTAVALAATLDAEVCEIYTDVAGVYTADPRVVPDARKLASLSYEEMLELGTSGAQVLMSRCVESARNQGVPIHVRSSFTNEAGTWIRAQEAVTENAIVAGVAHDTSEAKATLRGVRDQPGIAASIFRPLADAGINIDMIVQNTSADGRTDMSFTLQRADLKRARPLLEQVARDVGASGVEASADIARVSLVGAGMKTHPGVAADMFDALAEAGINIQIISTSPIRISCVVAASDIERAVRVVHERFKLHEPQVYEERAMA